MKTWIAAAALLALSFPARAWGEDAPKPPPPDLATPAPAAPPAQTPGVVLADPVQEKTPAEKAPEKDHGIFPLWSDWIREKGFTLPKPFGFMTTYYYQQSEIEISNLELSFNGGEYINFDEYIQVPKATAQASALGIRPNVMILPFLSVYALYSVGDTQTDVDVAAGPLEFSTVVESGAQVLSLGATFQMGYKGFFGVADFNAAVSDVERMADLVGSNLLSFRLGYNFGTPGGRGFALWAGTAGQVIDLETKGTVELDDVLPPPQQSTVDEIEAQCPTLPPGQRAACNALANQMQEWVDTGYSGTVSYRLDKKPQHVWNVVLGAQYAIDAYWMLRFETTFLNGRTSYMAAVEYRFDIY